MPINFPDNPTDEQAFTVGAVTYVYSSAIGAWNLETTSLLGPTGPAGPSNELTLGTVQTTPPAGEASVVITGESPSQTIDFVIPQGPTGPTGPEGNFTASETAPVGAIEGDAWFNTTDGTSYVYYDNYWIETSGSKGPTSVKILKENVLLGTVANTNTWVSFEVPLVAERGLVSTFSISQSTASVYDVEVRTTQSDSGEQLLHAVGVYNTYTITAPWYYESSVNDSLWIRVKNYGTTDSVFTLNKLRIERYV